MIGPIGGGDAPARLADHHDDLALVIELRTLGRPHQRLAMRDERFRETHEQARIAGRSGAVFVFLMALGIVDADAEAFAEVGQRLFEHDVAERVIRARSGVRRQNRQRSFAPGAAQQIVEARIVSLKPSTDIHDPVVVIEAEGRPAVVAEADDFHG